VSEEPRPAPGGPDQPRHVPDDRDQPRPAPDAREAARSAEPASSRARRTSPRRLARRASERIPPRAELMEQAAEASRAGLRSRRERIITVARPILQTSVAAAAAWLIATELVDHQQPFFAPISAVVTLGLTIGERRRRAVELAIGVSVGIAIADLLVSAIGTGTWQIGVTCGLAMLAATLVGGGPLLASQAGASAVLVATLQPPAGDFDFGRALDALVGSGTALAVGSLLLPVDPVRLVREGLGPVLDRLGAALHAIADALEHRDAREAERALTAVDRVDALYDHLTATLTAAGDAARISLGRRGTLNRLERYVAAVGEVGLAIENVRALARGAVRALALDDSTPPEVTAAIRELATAARELATLLEDGNAEPSRQAALHAVRLANAVLAETSNLSALHIVGQVRLVAVDLLRAGGMPRSDAQQAVRSAAPEKLG
jgi:uncharacterized membrane protein YgaE (UPF0421/DUF939 family)